MGPAFALNEVRRRLLQSLLGSGDAGPTVPPTGGGRPPGTHPAEAPVELAVITANEINDRHGTGVLLERVLRGRRAVFCIRSRNDYGTQRFGDWQALVPQRGAARPEWFRRVLAILGRRSVRQALCVPYLPDEAATAIAIQAAYGARLAVWIMDDQNVAVEGIPDEMMCELLRRSSLRLATHPELRYAYERKYGYKFWLLPAVVPDNLIAREQKPEPVPGGRPALVGSFWDQRWFERTLEALGRSGYQADWYGNHRSPWLRIEPNRLARAGVIAHGILPEAELASRLREHPFVIVPAAELEGGETNAGVAWLSLPGRILFALATAHTPVLVLGSEKTCAARFVRHFGVGDVAPYSASAVRTAMERLLEPETQSRCRARAAELALRFTDAGVGWWLAESIERGEPVDPRFEQAFAGYNGARIAEVLPARCFRSRAAS